MANIYRQNTRFRAEFFTHSGKAFNTNLGSNGDIINATINKSVGQPAGGFSVTLVPRHDYFWHIKPGDWVKLYIEDGIVDPSVPYMVGNVDTVQRSRSVDNKGAPTELIVIAGRDFGKVLLGCQVVYDTVMNNPDTVNANLELIGSFVNKQKDAKLPTLTPGEMVEFLLNKFFVNRQQFVPPGTVVEYTDDDTVVASPEHFKLHYQIGAKDSPNKSGHYGNVVNPNLNSNVWGLIKGFSHELLNELFIDTINGNPTLVLREYPFDPDTFKALTGISIRHDEITNESLTFGDSDVKNFFRVYPEGSGHNGWETSAAIDRVGVLNQFSIEKYGVKRMTPPTSFWFAENGPWNVNKDTGKVSGLMQEFSDRLARWHGMNEFLLSGTFQSRVRAEGHIGCRLDYYNERTDESYSFYVEGIQFNLQYPGPCTMTWTVTRGTPALVSGAGRNFLELESVQSLLTSMPDFIKVAKHDTNPVSGDPVTVARVDKTDASKPKESAFEEKKEETKLAVFRWPTVSHRITPGQTFSAAHNGIDIRIPVGTPVYAIGAGVVSASTEDTAHPDRSLGYYVTIKHDNGYISQYGHLSERLVTKGTKVTEGTQIAASGGAEGAVGAGHSSGPHLHFIIRKSDGTAIDPLTMLK